MYLGCNIWLFVHFGLHSTWHHSHLWVSMVGVAIVLSVWCKRNSCLSITVCAKIKAVPKLTESFLRRQRERGKNKKKSIFRSSVTLDGGGGCIDFTLRAPGQAPHYQSNSLIWISKTSSAIGFLPFPILFSRIYEHQLSVRRMVA